MLGIKKAGQITSIVINGVSLFLLLITLLFLTTTDMVLEVAKESMIDEDIALIEEVAKIAVTILVVLFVISMIIQTISVVLNSLALAKNNDKIGLVGAIFALLSLSSIIGGILSIVGISNSKKTGTE
ncbi:hypothetical protein SCHIN_v1c03780 [Spiroplasma chinense]|uniref:DUF4064 domain-containing protein n=1 Tax=Spiroplasma chinense TaxID=216932 RepID=A0A5B9Y448_9MOLU|nr:hypothetical protein [Spiroplasma chinense]QEH61575.1 hypothetical protein SCHIN_v1c03780 [Spiroplasma chinense]